jgi:putative hydrolase of the HAD superfamily
MLGHPVELLPAAAEIIPRLARDHTLLLITKGDLLDQRRKLEKSGLAPHFHRVEIVTEKNTAAYADILARHGIAPADFLMVGNSVKSDLLPVLALGGAAVHIPYSLLWEHERADGIPAGHPRLRTLESLAQLPALLEKGFPPAEK